MNMKMLKLFTGDDSSNNEQFDEIEMKNDKEKAPILSTQSVEYIMKEFPNIAGEIRISLEGLKNTLEKSIDHIEDKSCEIIKETRDFKLSGKYREASIELHDIGKDITAYVDWMDTNIKDKNSKNTKRDIKSAHKNTNDNKSEVDTKVDSSIDIQEEAYKAIFEDFTATQPCLFNIDKYKVEVESWEDLVVKTAEILTKHYKTNKLTNVKMVNNITIVKRKSKQNEFRDTIIDMLQEYNISLNRYKILLC